MSLTLLDGVYEEVVDDAPEIAQALVAGAAPVKPPKAWFENPKLDQPTPITVLASGQIYGHIASWHVDHIGIPGSRKPPRSQSNYSFFRTGVLETAEGHDVPVGQITLAGGHAALNADAGGAVRHYDDTATAFADVACGEDVHGIWVAGGVRPGATEEDIRAIRASAPSGDWRPINGQLEMVAVCQVNVPGFPVVRSMVAGGEVLSLVAAGAAPLYALRQEEALVASLATLENRVTRLEDARARRRSGLNAPESEADIVTTVVASAEPTLSAIERMQARLTEAKRMRLDERRAAVTASATRTVRTAEGAAHFGQPIGTPIQSDMLKARLEAARGRHKALTEKRIPRRVTGDELRERMVSSTKSSREELEKRLADAQTKR